GRVSRALVGRGRKRWRRRGAGRWRGRRRVVHHQRELGLGGAEIDMVDLAARPGATRRQHQRGKHHPGQEKYGLRSHACPRRVPEVPLKGQSSGYVTYQNELIYVALAGKTSPLTPRPLFPSPCMERGQG